METKLEKAVKNDEELAKMEAELEAEVQEEVKEEPVEQSEEETSESESAPEEEKPSEEETPEPEAEAEPEEQEELTDEEVEKLSKKAQKRFRKLSKELSELKKKELIDEVKAEEESKVKAPPVRKEKFPWERELPKVDVAEEARRVAREEVKREKTISQIESDAAEMEVKYEILNPEGDNFDEDTTKYLYDTFKSRFNEDNEYRLSDHVDKFMSLRGKATEQAKAEATQAAVEKRKQRKAEQAVGPTISEPRASKPDVGQALKEARTVKDLDALEAEVNRQAQS